MARSRQVVQVDGATGVGVVLAPRALARGRDESSAASMPTESRIRLPGRRRAPPRSRRASSAPAARSGSRRRRGSRRASRLVRATTRPPPPRSRRGTRPSAEVAHLPRGELVAGMPASPGYKRARRAGVAEERRDRGRVLAVPVHADGERLHAAQHQPASNGPGTAPRDFWRNAAAPRSRRRSSRRSRPRRPSGRRGTSSSSAARCRRRARAAAGGRASRTCCRRRPCAGLVRGVGGGADVDDVEQRVRRGLSHTNRVRRRVGGEFLRDLVRPRGM